LQARKADEAETARLAKAADDARKQGEAEAGRCSGSLCRSIYELLSYCQTLFWIDYTMAYIDDAEISYLGNAWADRL
jgi:hypothetical protein